MPQDRSYIEKAQNQRIKIKQKGLKYTPGTVNLQVVGSGAPGSPASVYIFTDHTKYLFNCGEGTQRLAHEHKTKLSRLEHVFMTRSSWECIGGLPGLSLTVQEAGVPELNLHGAVGLNELFHGMKRFVILKNLKVNTIDCENGGEYDDSVMNIKYVPLKKSGDLSTLSSLENIKNDILEVNEVDDTDYYAYEKKYPQSKNYRNKSNSPEVNIQKSSLNIKREEDTVIAYICKLKPKTGMLMLEKCVDKGVPPGPLLGQLKNGFDVTLPNGIIVRANDVRGPTDPGPVFIFLDIPNEHYLQSLDESNEVFSNHQSTTKDETKLATVIVHFSPQHIIETDIYQNFINRFTPSTKHLCLNSTNKFSGHTATHRIQWQLNQINPYVFPLLKECQVQESSKKLKLSEDKAVINTASTSNNLNVSNNVNNLNIKESNVQKLKLSMDNVTSLTCYNLRPRKGLTRDYEPLLEPLKYIQETREVDGFTQSLEKLQLNLESYYEKVKIKRNEDFPKIIFLGTGSCIPNKTRNVSSILLHINENSCMLLDCGEGTLGQLIRFYGTTDTTDILKKLKAIYISHLHADHHIGLIGILLARKKLLSNDEKSPLLLFAPKQILSWLYFYNQRIETINQEYQLISNNDIMTHSLSIDPIHEMGIKSIKTCLVKHCPYAYGVAIEIINKSHSQINNIAGDDGITKITYSGDTKPCNELVGIGMNSTILIHEATMEDELINEAKFKMHSTVSQAIEQGNKMNAKYTILTHFSQRYAKLPRIEESIQKNIGIAFDNMEITLNDLNCLHLMYPTLKIMFTEHCEEMEQKAIKRTQKERKRQASLALDESHQVR